MTKEEMAEVFADYVNEEKHKCFDGKSEKEILGILNDLYKGETWEDESPLPFLASDIKTVFENFYKEGRQTKSEIETDLDSLTEDKLDAFHAIAERLVSPFPDEDDEDSPPNGEPPQTTAEAEK